MVPGLRDPDGGIYNSEDTTGWGLNYDFLPLQFLPQM